MKQKFRSLIRTLLPLKVRFYILGLIPKIYIVNTYLLKGAQMKKNLSPVDSKFIIREIKLKDEVKLKLANASRGPNAFKRNALPRLKCNAFQGLAVFDTTNGNIAYIAWVVKKAIPFFDEFKIRLNDDQFFLKDGFCIPEYRHQGLHTRMEQERINYCVRNGAKEIFIQIHDSNEKGKASVLGNGYKLYKQNKVFALKTFNIFRELGSVLRNPFRRVVK